MYFTFEYLASKTSSNFEDLHKCGVYKLYHIKYPNLIYIGSASSEIKWRVGFRHRWKCHLQKLRANKHHSLFLQRIVNKYGIEGIRFEIIEICSSKTCIEKEQYYLDKFQPFGIKGYNTVRKAGSTLGLKIREDKKAKRKPVVQFSLDGEKIREFNSLNEASRILNINVSSIKDCCKRRFNQIKGYIFRYMDDCETTIPKAKYKAIIQCFYNEELKFEGFFENIKNQIPDKKCTVYKFLKLGTVSRNGWVYKKKQNE